MRAQTVTKWWRNADAPARWLVGIGLAVIGINVVAVVLETLLGGPGAAGPPSSSFTTGRRGLAAYAELLSDAGHEVSPLRSDPSVTTLDAGATVVLLDPQRLVPEEDARALRAFVERGGLLIAGGAFPGFWLKDIVPDAPSYAVDGAREVTPLVPIAETSGVGSIVGEGAGSWLDLNGALAFLASEQGETTAAVAVVGQGRVVLLADPSPLHNEFLDVADNAALGVAIAGDRERPVLFSESFHGYGDTGWRAIPASARWLVAGLTLAALVWMWSQARRLGPPEQSARPLPPPRREYVESVAAILKRSRRRAAAIEPLRGRARKVLARRGGVAPDASDDMLRRIAADSGLTATEIDALFGAVPDDRTVIEAGRGYLRLTRGAP